jgi:ABC-type transport system involved in cytochrome c biogenesis permease subunit
LAPALTGIGLFFHTIAIIVRWYSAGYIPIEGAFESYFLFAWFVALIYFVVELIFRFQILGVFTMPAVTILLGIAWGRYSAPTRLSSLVQSSWIVMHVTVVFIAYAAFILAAGFGLFYLVQENQLKKRSVNIFLRRLPPLETLDEFATRAVEFAELFMTMGIATGVIRAIKEGGNWITDPLIISTAVTWFIYAFYLFARSVWGWRGRRAAIVSIVGFISVMAIRFIVQNYTYFHKFGL